MCVHITKGLMTELAHKLGVEPAKLEWAEYKQNDIEILAGLRRKPPMENTRMILFSAAEAAALNFERVELESRPLERIRGHVPQGGSVEIIGPRDIEGNKLTTAPVFYYRTTETGAVEYALPVTFVEVLEGHTKWNVMIQLTNPTIPKLIRGTIAIEGNPQDLRFVRHSPDWAMGRNEEELFLQKTPGNPFED